MSDSNIQSWPWPPLLDSIIVKTPFDGMRAWLRTEYKMNITIDGPHAGYVGSADPDLTMWGNIQVPFLLVIAEQTLVTFDIGNVYANTNVLPPRQDEVLIVHQNKHCRRPEDPIVDFERRLSLLDPDAFEKVAQIVMGFERAEWFGKPIWQWGKDPCPYA